MHLIIIGGGAAGATAGFEARKFNQEAQITIFTLDKYTHYSPCGLPFVIAKRVPQMKNLIVYPPSLYRMSNISLYLETEVKKILPQEHKLLTTKGEFKYDKLIIATGSQPLIPPIKGTDKDGIYTLKTIEDGERILTALTWAKQVAVVGAGLIGLEMAVAFKQRGLNVKVIEKEARILPYLLDEDMADDLRSHLEKEGIEFYLGQPAQEIIGKNKVEAICIGKEELKCCIILLACGTKSNVYLAEDAGIELSQTGKIKVNSRMQTSFSDIYSAGDCVETVHLLTKRPIQSMSMLGSTATRQGKVAGMNAVGGNLTFLGSLNTIITELAGMEVGAVGLNLEEAKQGGFEPVCVKVETSSKDSFFPGAEKIIIKMLADSRTNKVIGAQMIGKEGIFGRLLAISFAIQKGISIDELSNAETAYVPSISPTFDPLTLTAAMLERRIHNASTLCA